MKSVRDPPEIINPIICLGKINIMTDNAKKKIIVAEELLEIF